MSEENLKQNRRSTRLSISIPIVISGLDADGNSFKETVRTLEVNKHGGRIETTHHFAKGAEILIENTASNVAAKACVVWLSEKHTGGELHHAGLQLHEPQNVWGIEFPPDDWSVESREEVAPTAEDQPAMAPAPAMEAETCVSSLAGEELTIRLLQELQQAADAHVQEFQDRVKQLTHRLGSELEIDLRERAAHAKAHEVGALEEEVRVLRESLNAARAEMGKLEASIEELKNSLQATTENILPPPTPLEEARRQLSTLADSVVESMNRAAEAGLGQYRSLLQKENQDSAARMRPAAKAPAPLPGGPSRKP